MSNNQLLKIVMFAHSKTLVDNLRTFFVNDFDIRFNIYCGFCKKYVCCNMNDMIETIQMHYCICSCDVDLSRRSQDDIVIDYIINFHDKLIDEYEHHFTLQGLIYYTYLCPYCQNRFNVSIATAKQNIINHINQCRKKN